MSISLRQGSGRATERVGVDSTGVDRYRRGVRRGVGLAVGVGLVATAGIATSMAGCLQDLSEPATCPAPPVVEGNVRDCFDAIMAANDAGQIDVDGSDLCLNRAPLAACYRGPSGCEFNGARDCLSPEDHEACFPSGDCPAKVREQFPDARCVSLVAEDIGRGLAEPEQCLCGCELCMSVCDGRGPVWAQIEIFTEDAFRDPRGYLSFDVVRHMPESGKLGVYVRARGLVTAGGSPAYLAVMREAEQEPAAFWFMPFDLNDRFEEVLLPPAGQEVYAWGNSASKPSWVFMGAGVNSLTLMEIDCVVPFVIE